MAKIELIHGDARAYQGAADLIMTDPPYDMPGKQLAYILESLDAQHLLLITTMKQLLEFSANSDWKFSFDFVLDAVMPKKSKSIHQPNFTHQTGVYMLKSGVKSAFDRRRRQRSDTFDNNGFWPTVLRAPRNRNDEHGMAKNLASWTDLLGSFDIESVVDPFAGSGTTALAALELDLDCTLVEIDGENCDKIRRSLKFIAKDFSYKNLSADII
ncbi:DNA methyltransferase [Ochrobactrum sp. A-1]|uniref:DNA methyltransferase n=1 Tax=Ochrobactrum sp. A-1 TaxID=2920940 RepID=UPI001F0A2D45|nr:site-specific DNA-methyltransferase [Ochrobactrum sp. A-1]